MFQSIALSLLCHPFVVQSIILETFHFFVLIIYLWLQHAVSLRGLTCATNESELAAFISYALAFPHNFLALVDTYNVSKSKANLYLYQAICLHGRTHLFYSFLIIFFNVNVVTVIVTPRSDNPM